MRVGGSGLQELLRVRQAVSLVTTPFLPERPGIYCLRMRVISEISLKQYIFRIRPCCGTSFAINRKRVLSVGE